MQINNKVANYGNSEWNEMGVRRFYATTLSGCSGTKSPEGSRARN